VSRIIAIDYGTKRVGLAVSDPLRIIASSLGAVHSSEVIAFLKKYISTELVELFVVGLPLKLDGSNSESAVHVQKFVSLLRKNFPEIPVERIDERFTSKIAKQTLLNMGVNKKQRQKKENTDQISAVLILQTFLETLDNK